MLKSAKSKFQLCSVIIPTYNASGTIERCIESILKSKYKNIEIIIVDDCSTDDTISKIKNYKCRIIKQKLNRGPALARNAGAKAAKGDILFFVDSDTAMYPDTISEAIATLSDKRIAAVIGIYSLEPLNKGFFPTYYCFLKHYSFTYTKISDYNVFAAQCAAIYRNIFILVKGFSNIKWGMDIENEELGRRIAKKYKMVINPAVKVRHKFAGFNKLLYIFRKRTFWWAIFFFKYKKFEKALTTKSFGFGTLAGPISLLFFILAAFFRGNLLMIISILIGSLSFLFFINAYKGFYKLCYKEKGLFFLVKCILSSYFFSFFVVLGVSEALLYYLIKILKGQKEEIFEFKK